MSHLSGQISDHTPPRALLQLPRAARFCGNNLCTLMFYSTSVELSSCSLHQTFDISVYLIIRCFVKFFPESSFEIGPLLIMYLILCLHAVHIFTPIFSTFVVPRLRWGKTKLLCAIYLFRSNCICGNLFLKAGNEEDMLEA